ncbi:MAG TPA: glycoside hydrolase family 88 protein [Phnomibacter sp.]|nr:glycoside hydrolase family 88 protein [Phnomibacter sp.]
MLLIGSILVGFAEKSLAQYAKPGSDASTPLHLLRPDYPMPYEAPTTDAIVAVADRVYNYLNATTPFEVVHKTTGAPITDFSKPDTNAIVKLGDFRLTSYEWGVTYSAMLRLSEATGNVKYRNYTSDRHIFLARRAPYFKTITDAYPNYNNPLKQVLYPHALDDAGAVCASMIKMSGQNKTGPLRPLIDRYIDYISNKEFRLKDGTLARNRPFPNTIWLDDLYMSVPALAQMGHFTGDVKYFDDAVFQVLNFSERMFNKQLGLYMHGWVQDMQPHPEFRWARANGWAIMAMAELLDVLPTAHPGYAKVLAQFQAHARGIASYQSGMGFWHQLLDRTDSYLETSATAIYAYCFAHGINKGWLDAQAFGPAAILAWNAVSTKVNEKGQVEGTCVGTGMGFEPAFYYHRPVNPYAAHGYGPVLLAAADIIILLKNNTFKLNDSALMFQ